MNDRKQTVGFREITAVVKSRKIACVFFYIIISLRFYTDYVLIKLYINSLQVTLTSYLEHGIE